MNSKLIFKVSAVAFAFVMLTGMGEIFISEDAKLKNYGANSEGAEQVIGGGNGWDQPVHPTTGRRPIDGAMTGDWAITPRAVFQNIPQSFNCDLNENSNEIHCLVCNCFHENANEPPEGRINVNRVVYTRELVSGFPNSICGVITQPAQFSWLNPGMKQRHQVLNTGMPGVMNCIQTTADASKYRGTWFASNYHGDYVRPSWRTGCRAAKQIGRHIFYTGGCYGVKPPTSFPRSAPSQQTPGVAWFEYFFGINKAVASTNPVEQFFKENPQYKYKEGFTKDVEKLVGEKNNPALVQGDFNGDGIQDAAAMVVKDNKHTVIFFISEGKTFVKKTKEIQDLNNIYLTMVPKQYVLAGLPNKKARDLVQIEVFMGPTQAFYVEKGKVIEFKGKLQQ